MKVLLTGITGNVGYEVSLTLAERGVDLIPCVRPGRTETILTQPISFEQIVECDLTESDIEFSGTVDCVVHCAGIVHFREAHNKNEMMMRRVVALAKKLDVPIYFVSTAFVYRPESESARFNNSYEQDKYNAEQVLVESGLAHGIFRPGVLTGNSRTGDIRNFSGYYQIARAFVSAVQSAAAKNQTMRFPRMLGESNMVPVDQAAACMSEAILANRLETMYVTNPAPPRSAWVLDQTLTFFDLQDSITTLDIPFQEFENLDLTKEEATLYRISQHFSPYWSMAYAFPPSICEDNLIDHDYMIRALTFFQNSENFYGPKTR